MVLLFSNTLGLYWLGIVSAFFMSIGTALTTSSIAVMTTLGTKLIQGYLTVGDKNSKTSKSSVSTGINGENIKVFVKLTGGILIVLTGAILLQSQPVGMSPIF